ncbi:MAG TPA: c-type cytochrome [Gemmatimonadales bacterium]|nr:c-type cytochrome [Gemmatimonadales bacterium]
MIRRILGWAAAILVVSVVGLLITIQLRWKRTFEATLPAITASTDSTVIAMGRYLAFGPAHCAECHTSGAAAAALERGEQPPLSGGFEFNIPPGKFRTPNLTPDSATGIGAATDGALARMIRYGVRRDGRAGLPFMNYHDLSDADLTALISFLRSQPPVVHAVPAHDLTLLGKGVMAFLIKPVGPTGTPPAVSPAGPTVERGAYLVGSVAECADCHTQRSMMDGHFTGPRLAGGTAFTSDSDATMEFVPPNLTPDPKTGRIAAWSEDQFVARFRQGRLLPGSPMPWKAFGHMSDDDLRAIYRYLHSLPPVERETGPSQRKKR